LNENQLRKPNRLIKETSPYLLQHAYNPVDWYPWGDEALQRASSEDKPIFLSIGYSSCHWCHVMAHESFENEEIAKIMNEHFVNIKLDREERPDLDDIYQRACQLTSGTGGWPLSIFLTPSQKPFYVGTYFPASSRQGMPGFATILLKLADAYKTKKDQVLSSTEEFMQALKETSMDITAQEAERLEKSMLEEAAVTLLHLGDPIHGGFGQAPKFPNASNLLFLLRAHELSGISKYKNFVIFTADKMAAGGIYDHIGGGFARYSTDQRWLTPHFEKMLYDNALLTNLYAELFQLTKDPRYLTVVRGILNYVLSDMTSAGGGFYSSEDADSEGVEGKFYVWSFKEISDSIDPNLLEPFCTYFGISHGGNFEGKNILSIQTSISSLSRKYSIPEAELNTKIRESVEKLYRIRLQRPRPGRDEKILASWNGLMISGFVDGYKITGDNKYLEAAKRAVEFIESRMTYDQNRLYRVFKDGISKISAYLDDYAFYVKGLLDLFAVESKSNYLKRAIDYTKATIDHFWDPFKGDFFFTPDDHEKLILRTKNHYDLAIPSGNSVTASNLLRLYYYTQEQDFLNKSVRLIKLSSRPATENPFGFGQLLSALYLHIRSPVEVCIINKSLHEKSSTGSEIAKWLYSQFIPNSIPARIDEGTDYEALQKYSYFKGKGTNPDMGNGLEYAYVCKDSTCSLPIDSVSKLQETLKDKNANPA
jgi:uncharacterized protein